MKFLTKPKNNKNIVTVSLKQIFDCIEIVNFVQKERIYVPMSVFLPKFSRSADRWIGFTTGNTV
jgi:hypothetical protein